MSQYTLRKYGTRGAIIPKHCGGGGVGLVHACLCATLRATIFISRKFAPCSIAYSPTEKAKSANYNYAPLVLYKYVALISVVVH